jgi:nucleoside-diphosphate-sugar epimerase
MTTESFWNQSHFDTYKTIYHCAAVVSYHAQDHAIMMEVNVHQTREWVDWALEFGVAFCHVSSIAALGKSEENSPIDEQCFWQPSKSHTEYSRTKFLGEMEVWRGIEEGLQAVIVNPGVIIGEVALQQSSGQLFGTAARGYNYYPLGGTGWIGVNDVAKIMLGLVEKQCWGERYILVAENQTMEWAFASMAKSMKIRIPQKPLTQWMLTLLYWVDALREKLSGKKAMVTAETIRNTAQIKRFSNEKIVKQLQWKFESVEDVIQQTALILFPQLPLSIEKN